jgi:hypothetical protein
MLPTKLRFIWPSGFGGKDFKKSANQKQELPVAPMFVNRSGHNEQSLERTFHRCFLPSYSTFGWEVAEEKIKMWKVNGRQTPSDGKTEILLKVVLNTITLTPYNMYIHKTYNAFYHPPSCQCFNNKCFIRYYF